MDPPCFHYIALNWISHSNNLYGGGGGNRSSVSLRSLQRRRLLRFARSVFSIPWKHGSTMFSLYTLNWISHSNNLYGGGGGNRTRVRRYRHEDIYRLSLYFKSRLAGPYRHGPDRPAFSFI